MNIPTLALYEASDQGSLHVRLADECVLLDAPGGFMNGGAILDIARAHGADALHPGYGFLAEHAEFCRACENAGITFIGPPARVMEQLQPKIDALERVRAAGIATTTFSMPCADSDAPLMTAEANALGYPLLVKSCRGGRGRGEFFVASASELPDALARAQQEAHAVYGDRRVFLEKAILPAHQIGVQILGDAHGNLIHLGEREGSLMPGTQREASNQKLIEETPAPSLTPKQRARLWELALEIARVFGYVNAGTIEFLMDDAGNFYFTEVKARIQIEHPLTELVTRVDLVRAQIELAAGAPLALKQADVRLDGYAMQCRINAQDPWNQMLPSPGYLRRVRLPGGPEVRIDTYVYSGCQVPAEYDSLIAKLIVWGADRAQCRQRLERALGEFKLIGTATTLPLLQRLVRDAAFVDGTYHTQTRVPQLEMDAEAPQTVRDLAAAVALYHERAQQPLRAAIPTRMLSGWHRASRTLPE